MNDLLKKMSIMSKGLRYKLMVAFSLMSIIPLLVLGYLVINYIFSEIHIPLDISIIVLLSVIVALLGFILVKRVVEPVIDIAMETKMIASGQYEKRISIAGDDELANLADSINLMSQRIKSNLEELKNYGQKTKEINIEIHKRVLVLSNLLQVGDIISTRAMDLKDILELIVSKVAQVNEGGFGVLFLSKGAPDQYLPAAAYNLERKGFEEMVLKDGMGLLGKAIFARSVLIVDSSSKKTKETEDFVKSHGLKNLIAFPVFAGKETFGMLIVGNRLADYKFSRDDIDIVSIFAKQISIAIENDRLLKKTKELALKDDLTDLYNKNYILPRMDEDIKRAIFYQRPCSFLALNIDNSRTFCDMHGELSFEQALRKVAGLLKEYEGQFGKAARIGWDEFALLLPEKNKREAMDLAEDIRRRVESVIFADSQKMPMTVSIGVSENPIDGSTKDDLFKKAQDALARAKEKGKNRVMA